MFDIFTREGLISFLYFIPALLLSLAIHEYGHAIVAYMLGDKSQKIRGRLTISPFAHIDWLGFICIVLCGFGWGKPVMIDDSNFKKRGKGNMLVALAGPAFNIILAIVITILIKILMLTGLYEKIVVTSVGNIVMGIIFFMIQFNIIFGIFNLIPLPPFDGSKILYYFLPYKLKSWMDVIEKYSIWILLILFLTDASVYIITPAYRLVAVVINFILLL